MQDPSLYAQINPPFPEQEHLKCPRCDSPNTKFCYFNNYNLSQPRHFCKNCRRYWTKGGALRNIPVGGGSRKNTKRSSTTKKPSSSSSSPPSPSPLTTTTTTAAAAVSAAPSTCSATSTCTSAAGITAGSSSLTPVFNQGHRFFDVKGENPNALLGSLNEGQFSNFLKGLSSGSNLQLGEPAKVQIPGSGRDGVRSVDHQTGCVQNGWPDLAIYTPGSSFQ